MSPDEMAAGPAAVLRDLVFERRWTAQAADSAGVQARGLSDFAESRAGRGPVVDVLTRNFLLEVLEELADARNYLVWWAWQIALRGGQHLEVVGELTGQIACALAAVCVAYDAVDRARGLISEWREAAA